MYIVSKRYLRDHAEAEDALQEAFIKAFRKLGQFKGEVTFGAWLKRIVINTCLDAIKAKKVEMYPLQEEFTRIPEAEDDWSVPDTATVNQVLKAINDLPGAYKTVLNLYLLEGYDHGEIAQIMGISESTSRTNLHRGKLKLKEKLNHVKYGTGY